MIRHQKLEARVQRLLDAGVPVTNYGLAAELVRGRAPSIGSWPRGSRPGRDPGSDGPPPARRGFLIPSRLRKKPPRAAIFGEHPAGIALAFRRAWKRTASAGTNQGGMAQWQENDSQGRGQGPGEEGSREGCGDQGDRIEQAADQVGDLPRSQRPRPVCPARTSSACAMP